MHNQSQNKLLQFLKNSTISN